ncbi:MAG: radical SAM protein [Candidatus Altiarchaeota archaeon]
MCYSIPGRVVEVAGRTAVVDYFGERRNVLNELRNVNPGDYVYAQGGFVVQVMPEEEAKDVLELWREAFFKLQRLDEETVKNAGVEKVSEGFSRIIGKAKAGGLEREDILQLLDTTNPKELSFLYSSANRVRHESLKNSCCVHGIIEFSNHCGNNCLYCGIREGNSTLPRYRMSVEEIVEAAAEAVNVHGFRALVLQSGEDDWYTPEILAQIIRGIKERCGVLLFMSVGTRDLDCYREMYEAGARGVLLRFETSNPRLYSKMHAGSKSTLKDRIKTIEYAVKLGFVVATGSLIGLPGQTKEDIANDILLTKSLKAEMYSFGPFIPSPQTPLADAPAPEVDTVLKALAVSRLADPQAKILVTTALEALGGDCRRRGLLTGGNSLMVNLTPLSHRRYYSIYPGHSNSSDTEDQIKETLKLLYSLGRAPTDLGVKANA